MQAFLCTNCKVIKFSLRLQPFDLKGSIEGCQQQWGVTPRPMWATIAWGGKRIDTASNIVFTNGLLDPWCVDVALAECKMRCVAESDCAALMQWD